MIILPANPAGIIQKFSTAAATPSVLTARPASAGAPGLLSASFHRYGGVRGERDGVKFAKRQRRDVSDIVEEERQRN